MSDKNEIQRLRHDEFVATQKVASISRKLAGGSKAVSQADLDENRAELHRVQNCLIAFQEVPASAS